MLRFNNSVILLGGISLIALSACTPRGSGQNAMSTQNSQGVQTALLPTGVNNQPLYTGNIASQQLSATMLPIETNIMAGVDNIATGSITPQASLQPTAPAMYPTPINKSYSAASETAYRVQTGDTIYSIGRKFNVHPGEIIARNNIANPNQLVVGQSFKVPTNGNYTAGNTNITPYQTPQAVQKYVPAFPQTASSPTISQSYTVQSGDTLYSIGRKFNIHPTYIINKNPSVNPNQLAPGQVLNIATNNASNPQAHEQVARLQDSPVNFKPKPITVDNTSKNIMGNSTIPNTNDNLEKQILSNALVLPVQGAIKENKNLRGILISASDGDAVKASASGEVIYVGNLNNYGNMVLVRHDNGLVTNYARLKKTFVQKGQKVSKGDLIASAGVSREFNTSDVLFEVRKGTQAVNPLDYIG
jgi:murein DD-endopeptidase MepM/ murein hydrolase activator NlpD